MRQPTLKAGIAVAALMLFVIIAFNAFFRLELNAQDQPIFGPWAAVALGSVIAAIFTLYFLVRAAAAAGAAKRLDGGNWIASWTLGPSEWARFRGVDLVRSGQFRSLRNRFRPRLENRPEGVEVVFGEGDVLVDGFAYPLRVDWGFCGFNLRHVHWLEGKPPCLEFSGSSGEGRNGWFRMHTIRVPVAEAAIAEGRAVLDHYLSQISEDHEHYARGRDPDHFDALESDPGSARALSRSRDFLFHGLSTVITGAGAAFLGWAVQSQAGVDPESETFIWVLVNGGIAAAVGGAIAIAIGLFLATRR